MRMKGSWPLALLMAPAIVLAQESFDSVVQWSHIVGVITAPGVNNPVAGINARSRARGLSRRSRPCRSNQRRGQL